MKAVILHGGQGTRLRPLTHTGPKQLIKVAGKPISQWALEQVRDAGVKDVILILGDNVPNKVVEYYGDGSRFGVRITYVYQGKARGLADAVYRVRGLVKGERFLVYLGDNVVNYDLGKFASSGSNASILLAKVQDPSRFGVAVIREGKLVKLVEKPKERISDLALVGVYSFDDNVFDVIEGLRPSWRGELEITDAIQGLVDRGLEVSYDVADGWWKDTGTPKDILEANAFLLDAKVSRRVEENVRLVNSSVEGRVYLGRNALVQNSVVRGPAYVGENTVVKDSYVGPYTSIGDNCVVEGSEVEHSVILDNVKVEGGVFLMDSLIGNNAVIRKGNRWHKLVVGENSWITL
ncbi:glucose-1-phosphate thymidylyltransferase [Metallosphaera tengchongensis]|uniref:Glucose-1-phosphate thymidylyltransferase n=1 Tax=Metallosphaera tengchongensis TaxID=1532350 RepID=A0A6N0NZ76_9CREN|nr:glucose-1-phosphate thymidylyltransferase [Metallosphaera tengchongensis]QKR00839.1 glucose-1-phosphate thymidylyltransferase [Metallosphaera tengchongensis]